MEPTGALEDDPNVTDKRFPGPHPVLPHPRTGPGVGGVEDWVGHPPEQLQTMRDHLDELERQGRAEIDDEGADRRYVVVRR